MTCRRPPWRRSPLPVRPADASSRSAPQLRARLNPRRTRPAVVRAGAGVADVFIYPGFEFKVVDALLTNFHLPKSSLLMLVSAFAGRDLTLAAYRHAVREGFHFYSYGDAMLIL